MKIDLSKVLAAKTATEALNGFKLEGASWSRPSMATIQSLYGTTTGKIPLDIDPRNTAPSGDNFTVSNMGGAGALFNMLTQGGITLGANKAFFQMIQEGWIQFTGQPDLVDTRLFIVSNVPDLSTNFYFAGNSAGGNRSNLILYSGGASLRANQNTGSGWVNADATISPKYPYGKVTLTEIEMFSQGSFSVFINGVKRGSGPNTHASYPLRWLGAGQNTGSGGLSGQLYRVISLIRGGDYEANTLTIRNRLMEQYPISL